MQQLKNIMITTANTTNSSTIKLLFTFLLVSSNLAQASDWILAQGTEKYTSEGFRLHGFVQPTYQVMKSGELPAGAFAGERPAFNQVTPYFKSSNSFTLYRARLGVRGWVPKTEKRVNFRLLLGMGQNAITSHANGGAQIVDASATFKTDWGSYLRVGQFKYPGPEEGLLPIFKHPFIFYSLPIMQMMMERFFDQDGSDTSSANLQNGSIGANRDQGVKLFHKFQFKEQEHTYAIMVGNGNGLNRADNNDEKDLYLFWALVDQSTESKWKLSLWGNWGERTLGRQNYARRRSGLGLFYERNGWNFGAEYIEAEGMIFSGTDGGAVPGVSNGSSQVSSFNVEPLEAAVGGYLQLGYRYENGWGAHTRLELYRRNTKTASKSRTYETAVVAVEKVLTKNTRVVTNYELRRGSAPNLPASHAANQILQEMSDRLSAQLVVVF